MYTYSARYLVKRAVETRHSPTVGLDLTFQYKKITAAGIKDATTIANELIPKIVAEHRRDHALPKVILQYVVQEPL